MRIESRTLWRGLLAAALSTVLGSATAANHPIYIPFTLENNAGTQAQNLWLADTANLGNPPFQLTNQVLDGPFNGSAGNIAILDDWTLNAATHLATNVQPQLVVYGVGGHLYKANLKTIAPVQQFSSGSYAELCNLIPLDQRPFAAAKAYVQALVEPVGSADTCASGTGMQTWLIPANADGTVAPTIEPQNWAVLGAFTDPTNDSFVRWIVWTGNAVAAYKANFSSSTTLLVGPPAGIAPTLIGRVDGNAYLLSGSDNGTIHTDSLYHVSMTASGLAATYSYADGSPCSTGITTTGVITSSLPDTANGILLYTEPSSAGYGVYSVPLAGGAPTQIYADGTGSECGAIGGDSVSAGYVGVDEANVPSGFQHVLGINETGPVTQTPVFLAGGVNQFAFLRYAIDGHFWITIQDQSMSPPALSVMVADGNGNVLATYNNARIGDDIWSGYSVPGRAPVIQRDLVYLFSPTGGGGCHGGTLTAVDPAAFTTTSISGLPADACSVLAFGWLPASVGFVQEPAGSSPVEVDPVGGKMYTLLGPDPSGGLFLNVANIYGYPFF